MPNEYDSYTVPIVVAIIEGGSDKKYLKQPLEAYFRDKYGKTCKLIPVTDLTSNPDIKDEDFIKTLIGGVETKLRSKENMVDEDVAVMISEVVHIFDIDEAYIDEDHIYIDSDHPSFFYTREGIRHISKNPVIQRNERKQRRIEELLSMSTINLFGMDFPYSVYFYSVNIDDFHYDDALNWDEETKNKKAAEFERQYLTKNSYKGKVKMFLKLFEKNNPSDFPTTHNDTWNYIKCDNNSLKKCSNVFLIIKQ